MNEREKMYIYAALFGLFKLANAGSAEFACKVDGEWISIEYAEAIEYFESLLRKEADNG